MNTSSVSSNRMVPESTKTDFKAKSVGAKTEQPTDSFKDMIKNASSQKQENAGNAEATVKEEGKKEQTGGEKAKGSAEAQVQTEVAASPVVVDQLAVLLNNVMPVTQVATAEVVQASAPVAVEVNVVMNDTAQAAPDTAVAAQGEKAAQAVAPQNHASEGKDAGAARNTVQQQGGEAKQTQADTTVQTGSNKATAQTATTQAQHQSAQTTQTTQTAAPNGQEAKAAVTENKDISPEALAMAKQDTAADNVVRIKVAEPAGIQTFQPVAEEIGEVVVNKISDEVQQVKVLLNPAELGEIEVEFHMEQGKVSVTLSCSNEATKNLLNSNLDSLVKVIQGGLMQETTVNVNNDRGSTQQEQGENYDGRGNNGGNQNPQQEHKREDEPPKMDFIHRLRLNIEELEGVEV